MSRGRPRKSEVEKRARQREYWQGYKERMTEEQKARRRETSNRYHRGWAQAHRKELAEYMREYRAKRKQIDKKGQV